MESKTRSLDRVMRRQEEMARRLLDWVERTQSVTKQPPQKPLQRRGPTSETTNTRSKDHITNK